MRSEITYLQILVFFCPVLGIMILVRFMQYSVGYNFPHSIAANISKHVLLLFLKCFVLFMTGGLPGSALVSGSTKPMLSSV